MSDTPSMFSSYIPKLQIAWDATSFKALMTCPRQYQYAILEGWRPIQDKIDLEFGGYFASSVERYKKARVEGRSKQEATLTAVRYAIEASWIQGPDNGTCPCPDGCNGCERTGGGPWGGRYEEMWNCTGTTPFKNAKGNRAKCPYSHKGSWFPAPGPSTCSCGSNTHTERQWISNDKAKDRYTLVRLVAWYCDEQPELASDGAMPYVFPNGQPAVELSFKIPLPWKVPPPNRVMGIDDKPETYILAGHIDSIMEYGSEHFVSDNKTTKNMMGAQYFAQFHPNIQMDIYDLAGTTLYPTLNLKGVMIEAAQTLAGGARFGVGLSYRTDAQREELMGDIRYWLTQAEKFATEDHWPMNRANCYLCPFKVICSKDPGSRQRYLEAAFVKQPWNPLLER